ncbi:MAG: MFS transporter, partial [Candidatus Izemoplasmatales bacterium]
HVKSKWWELVLFSGNETATTASFNLITVFFMLMMTDNLLLSGVIAGAIFAVSRVVDAITDPLIGTLIDRTVTKFGRYRPFILLGSVTLNIGIFMIFGGVVRFQSDVAMYLWITFWYFLYIVGYTFQSACTRSAQTILTNDKFQRPLLGALLSSWSYLFYGIFLIKSLDYVMSFEGGASNPEGYRNLALLVIVTNLVLTFLSILGLTRKDRPSNYANLPNPEKVTLVSIVRLIKHNTPLRALMVAAGTNKLAQLITGTSLAYFFIYTVKDISLQQVVATWGLYFGVLGVVIGLLVAQWWGRKKSFMLGTYLGLLFPILIVIIHPFSESLKGLLVGFMVAIVFATALASSNVLPLIADVADYEYYKYKQYIPSIVGTTFSLIDKLMSSFSGVILGLALHWIDYTPDMAPTTKAFWAFYFMVIIIPALGHVASIIAFRYFPINRAFYTKMIEESPIPSEITETA